MCNAQRLFVPQETMRKTSRFKYNMWKRKSKLLHKNDMALKI